MSDSVLPEIVNDPDLIVESDEDMLPDELQIEMKVRDIDPEEVFEKKKKDKTSQARDPVVKPVKKDPKPKRQMSEAHKLKLAEAREKALETRRRNASEKKKLKELETKVNKKQKEQKIKQMENIVNDIPEAAPPPVKAEIDDSIIQKAIEEALTKQEMMRQERKRIKKQKQDEEIKKAKAQELIRAAVYPSKLYAGDQGFASKHIFNFN